MQYGEKGQEKQDRKAPLHEATHRQEGTRKSEEARRWKIGGRDRVTLTLTAMAVVKEENNSDLPVSAMGRVKPCGTERITNISLGRVHRDPSPTGTLLSVPRNYMSAHN